MSFYLSLPSQYLCKIFIKLLIAVTISLFISLLFNDFDQSDDSMLYNISFAVLSLILIPLCLIKNFEKIKILSYAALILSIGILICMIGLITEDKEFPPLLLQGSDFFSLNSPWLYLGEFFQLFQVQIFYLWVL